MQSHITELPSEDQLPDPEKTGYIVCCHVLEAEAEPFSFVRQGDALGATCCYACYAEGFNLVNFDLVCPGCAHANGWVR
jgi:hypothetical protein